MSQEVPQPVVPGPQIPQTSTLAIVSLATGIATWIILPVVGALAAIITGHLAKNEIRSSMGRLTGAGLATAGLILGYLQVLLIVSSICVIVILALLGPTIGTVFSNIIQDI